MDISLTAASYLAAALSFGFLGISLLISWRGQYRGALLTLACLVTAAWGGLNAYGGLPLARAAMEVARSAFWLLFIWEVLAGAKAVAASRLLAFRSVLVSFSLLLLALTFYVQIEPSGLGLFVIIGHVILAIMGMALVEQLYRNTHPDSRWGIKFVCLAIGAMFSYDFFLYSDAMLFHRIDPDIWMARGVVNAIVAPLIMVSAARNPQWSLRVHMSRHVVFHSAALLGAGVYLLLMAAAGYYIRIFGGTWGSVLQIAFFFGASILLLAILFSGSMRARLRVLLSKHFFTSRYDYREEWLRFTRTLLTSEKSGQIYEAAIRAIAALVESPAGALWLAQEQGGAYACVARWNMPMPQSSVPSDDPVVQFMAESQWVVNLDEYRPDRERHEDLEISAWLMGMKDAWIVVPLMVPERMLGFIVLNQPRSEIHFNWEVSDLLKTAGHQLANHLAQKLATDALLVARQFDSFNRMSAFVVHDLKNLVAQLSLMLSNAEKHRDNPEFQEDMLNTVQNSVDRMNRLLSQLRSAKTSSVTEVALQGMLESVLDQKSALKPRPFLISQDGNIRVRADLDKLTRVIGHIVQNACEATRYDGRVEVRLHGDDGHALIEVEDNGKGMDEEFIRERLFKPFDSTKNSGMGIGAYECQEYIRELGGSMEVKSVPEQGTLFRIFIPRA